MAVTLEWVRDNYDASKNRLIEESERDKAVNDWGMGHITMDQASAVMTAYNNQTLLPAYDTPPPSGPITCSGVTPHYSSGCALLNHYDASGDGIISMSELGTAVTHKNNGVITADELTFIEAAWKAGSINALCSGCYEGPAPVCTPGARRCRDANTVEQCRADGSGWDVVQTCGSGFECKIDKCVATSAPNTETRTVSLTEGSHTIQVSFTGYDTLNATINVSSTGVTCISVIGGACGGSSLPRVSTSGWTVTTYLKSGAVTTNRCTWIATQDTSKVASISEMVLAYNNLKNIGFTPSASEIGDAVLMYSNLGTPASLWGC